MPSYQNRAEANLFASKLSDTSRRVLFDTLKEAPEHIREKLYESMAERHMKTVVDYAHPTIGQGIKQSLRSGLGMYDVPEERGDFTVPMNVLKERSSMTESVLGSIGKMMGTWNLPFYGEVDWSGMDDPLVAREFGRGLAFDAAITAAGGPITRLAGAGGRLGLKIATKAPVIKWVGKPTVEGAVGTAKFVGSGLRRITNAAGRKLFSQPTQELFQKSLGVTTGEAVDLAAHRAYAETVKKVTAKMSESEAKLVTEALATGVTDGLKKKSLINAYNKLVNQAPAPTEVVTKAKLLEAPVANAFRAFSDVGHAYVDDYLRYTHPVLDHAIRSGVNTLDDMFVSLGRGAESVIGKVADPAFHALTDAYSRMSTIGRTFGREWIESTLQATRAATGNVAQGVVSTAQQKAANLRIRINAVSQYAGKVEEWMQIRGTQFAGDANKMVNKYVTRLAEIADNAYRRVAAQVEPIVERVRMENMWPAEREGLLRKRRLEQFGKMYDATIKPETVDSMLPSRVMSRYMTVDEYGRPLRPTGTGGVIAPEAPRVGTGGPIVTGQEPLATSGPIVVGESGGVRSSTKAIPMRNRAQNIPVHFSAEDLAEGRTRIRPTPAAPTPPPTPEVAPATPAGGGRILTKGAKGKARGKASEGVLDEGARVSTGLTEVSKRVGGFDPGEDVIVKDLLLERHADGHLFDHDDVAMMLEQLRSMAADVSVAAGKKPTARQLAAAVAHAEAADAMEESAIEVAKGVVRRAEKKAAKAAKKTVKATKKSAPVKGRGRAEAAPSTATAAPAPSPPTGSAPSAPGGPWDLLEANEKAALIRTGWTDKTFNELGSPAEMEAAVTKALSAKATGKPSKVVKTPAKGTGKVPVKKAAPRPLQTPSEKATAKAEPAKPKIPGAAPGQPAVQDVVTKSPAKPAKAQPVGGKKKIAVKKTASKAVDEPTDAELADIERELAELEADEVGETLGKETAEAAKGTKKVAVKSAGKTVKMTPGKMLDAYASGERAIAGGMEPEVVQAAFSRARSVAIKGDKLLADVDKQLNGLRDFDELRAVRDALAAEGTKKARVKQAMQEVRALRKAARKGSRGGGGRWGMLTDSEGNPIDFKTRGYPQAPPSATLRPSYHSAGTGRQQFAEREVGGGLPERSQYRDIWDEGLGRFRPRKLSEMPPSVLAALVSGLGGGAMLLGEDERR